MKKPIERNFTSNVVVTYYKGINPNQFREPIHDLLKGLAWLYSFDYSIDSNSSLFDGSPETDQITVDLIYFRSGKNSAMSFRDFKNLIDTVFSKSLTLFGGVDVFCQTRIGAKKYPFPNEFCRPLNYPYVEMHTDSKAEIMVKPEALLNL
jgi:hypothetical protein